MIRNLRRSLGSLGEAYPHQSAAADSFPLRKGEAFGVYMVENYLINIVFFTNNGEQIYKSLKTGLKNAIFDLKDDTTSLKNFTKGSFEGHIPLIFIGATGIAVRTIAPFIEDKLSDIPVIVIDEKGINVIPVLSGHYGMGNDLAKRIAEAINANAIITTATDIEQVFAIDSFAARNGFRIQDKSKIKNVSMKLLAKKEVYVDNLIEGLSFFDDKPAGIKKSNGKKADIIFSNDRLDDSEALVLTPKMLVVGMGCKRGKGFEDLLGFLLEDYSLEELRKNLYAICSIDKKADEIGLLRLAAYLHTKLITFTAEELEATEGDFQESAFVKEKVGCGNVSERAAVSIGGRLILKKVARDGMTKAYAARDLRSIKWQD